MAGGAADDVVAVERGFEGDSGEEVVGKLVAELAEFVERKIAELAAFVETIADGVADLLMRFAEGDALVDEIRGGSHGVEEAGGAGGAHASGAEDERAGERREHAHHFVGFGRSGEDRLLGLLQVFVVGEGQAFEQQGDGFRGSVDAADLGADELREVGVLLLRHRAGAGGEGFGQIDESELRGGEESDLFAKAAGVERNLGEHLEVFEDEVAAAGRIHAVGRGGDEVEFARGDAAVNRQSSAGHCARAERAIVQACNAIFETRSVAEEHFDVSEEPVSDEDGFGALQMRISRHDRIARSFCLGEKSLGPFGELADQRFDAVADVEAQIGGDLLVAAAAGMELQTERAHGFRQAQFDEMVDVLSLRIVADLVELRRVIRADGFERADDPVALVGGENARGAQRERVRPAGSQFFPEKQPVEANGALPLIEEGIGRGAKAAGPHFGGLFGHELHSPFVVPLLSCGISEPWLRVMRPLWA